MNYKHMLFLSFLLIQTAPAWSMDNSDDRGFDVDNRFFRQRHQITPAQHDQNVRDRHYVSDVDEEVNGNHHLTQLHYEEAFQSDKSNHDLFEEVVFPVQRHQQDIEEKQRMDGQDRGREGQEEIATYQEHLDINGHNIWNVISSDGAAGINGARGLGGQGGLDGRHCEGICETGRTIHRAYQKGTHVDYYVENNKQIQIQKNDQWNYSTFLTTKTADQYLVSSSNYPEILCPLEIREYILSFLDQWSLLKAGGISKAWRKAAEMVWKTKPLCLPDRVLNQTNYNIFTEAPFSSLILTAIQLAIEEPGKESQVQKGLYQLLPLQNEKIERIEKWQRVDEVSALDAKNQKQIYDIYPITHIREEIKVETYEMYEPYAHLPFSPFGGLPCWWPIRMMDVSCTRNIPYQVFLPNLWKISKTWLATPQVLETQCRIVQKQEPYTVWMLEALPDVWHVSQKLQTPKGSAPNGNPGNGLNTNGHRDPTAQAILNRNDILLPYRIEYQQATANPGTVDFIRPFPNL